MIPKDRGEGGGSKHGLIPSELIGDKTSPPLVIRTEREREHRGAPLINFLFQELESYLLESALPPMSAFSVAPRARAYFLPAKRTSETASLPLEWSTTAES